MQYAFINSILSNKYIFFHYVLYLDTASTTKEINNKMRRVTVINAHRRERTHIHICIIYIRILLLLHCLS